MTKVKLPTPIQTDSIIIAGILATGGASREARQKQLELDALELEHDWHVGCIRQAHKTKRGRGLIAEAIPDKEDKFKHVSADNYIRHDGTIEIRIEARWGAIEYTMKATKSLRNVRRKLDAVRDELSRCRRERNSTRPKILERQLRAKLKAQTPEAAKSRAVILREMRKLLET
jgi:hypothetical protein